ncbi:NADH-quinone oxidoreductase subunit N (mitochondrion) [Fonticula alba]|uniref:NADH-quinone oxidoreductase subunit N n=1 Tax=Fonticula alba TaxID=691883 RepID=A0A058YZ66_FONAL|nr:NADH-quinone oxidoreductase subunit N [Fonticula alba]KCV67171.1 NADH-quinone oxidoreductase subunit N [Fonticula alba]|eukprot:XP_009498421.1 NADH-quinone oxidoreductase subunit N (mitochondrion) [Fonticula alba]
MVNLVLVVLFTGVILVLIQPEGVFFGFDHLIRFSDATNNIKFLVLTVSALLIYSCRVYLSKYLTADALLVLLLSIIGMFLALMAYDFRLMFIGLELMGISFYILIALDKNIKSSIKAGLNYYVVGSAMTAINLLGIVMVYKSTGSFNWLNQSQINLFLGNDSTLSLGVMLIIISLLFKLAAAPFHLWAPKIYGDSSLFMVIFQGLIPKMPLLFIMFSVINFVSVSSDLSLYTLIWLSVCLSVLLGSLGLLFQSNFKTIFIYSSITNIGLALSAVSNMSETSAQTLAVFITIYTLMSVALAILFFSFGTNNLRALKGLIEINPYLAIAAALILFSLAGVPPLAGFYSKFSIIYNTMYNETFIVMIPLIIGSCVSAFYYLYLIKTCFLDKPESKTPLFITYYQSLSLFVATGVVLLVSTKPWLVVIISGTMLGMGETIYV